MAAETRIPRGHVSVRSYKTDFKLDEAPISEGGRWINGKTDGLDWADIVTENGYAHGSATRSVVTGADWSKHGVDEFGHTAVDYDDPTAVLAGEWGKDQYAKATVFSRNQTDEYFQEVEIRLRTTITPRSITGYEVFWNCRKTEDAYAEIVRWNGKYRDWTRLGRKQGPEFGVKDGDVVEATVEGNVIKSFINGVEVLSVTDDTFASGSPGIGFNLGCDDTYVDHGFTSFEVDSDNG
jgi:hypothetical protein